MDQGVSSAGLQRGMNDGRTELIKEVWRVFDSLSTPLGAESTDC